MRRRSRIYVFVRVKMPKSYSTLKSWDFRGTPCIFCSDFTKPHSANLSSKFPFHYYLFDFYDATHIQPTLACANIMSLSFVSGGGIVRMFPRLFSLKEKWATYFLMYISPSQYCGLYISIGTNSMVIFVAALNEPIIKWKLLLYLLFDLFEGKTIFGVRVLRDFWKRYL